MQPLPGAVPTPGVNVSKELFGEADGQSVYRFTLSNNRNLSVQVLFPSLWKEFGGDNKRVGRHNQTRANLTNIIDTRKDYIDSTL